MRISKAQKRDIGKSLTLIIVIALAVIFIPKWVRIADCGTGRDGLLFLDRCIASEHCQLTAREMQRFEAYTRMLLLNCKD